MTVVASIFVVLFDLIEQQAGAELCQAQVKLEVVGEIGFEFRVEVEVCHY